MTVAFDQLLADLSWDYFPNEEPIIGESFTDDTEIIKYFTQGQCNALAWELFKLKRDDGFKLAMLSDGPLGSFDYYGHIFLVKKDMALDIKGYMPIEDMEALWPRFGYYHEFRSVAEFRKEMQDWDNYPRPVYNKDPEAKYWARIIVDMLE